MRRAGHNRCSVLVDIHPHTRLINYTIALCKGHKNTFSPLGELGYDVQLMEQNIRTSAGEEVKPDVIKVSKRRQHAIIFECKSGTDDEDQMRRYGQLTDEDLRRWLTVAHPSQPILFDICIVNIDTNQGNFANVRNCPILTFSQAALSKSNVFSIKEVEDKFSTPIPIDRDKIPLSYYPFSDLDSDSIIMERVLRQLVSMVIKLSRGGTNVLDLAELVPDNMLSALHPYWLALSEEHRNKLRTKIQNIIRRLRDGNPTFAERLTETRTGNFRVRGPPASFTALCDQIIQESRVQRTLN
jgi:hypothetical protein